MRVLSWNVNKSSNRQGRIDEQLNLIKQCNPDIVLLQEVRYGRDQRWLEVWERGLEEQGLGEIVHSCDWAAELATSEVQPHANIGHDNGHITAVSSNWKSTRKEQRIRNRIDESDWSQFDTHFPEKILVADVELAESTVELWNVRAVPGNGWGEEKIKIFETVYNRLTNSKQRTRILAGDFNTPAQELPDGQAIPFGYAKNPEIRQRWVEAELSLLKGLGHIGLVDVFREQHGYGDIDTADTSWKGKRFDHIYASNELTCSDCIYEQSGYDCSDHAPIIAGFKQ